MDDDRYHWANDRYWTNCLDDWIRLRDKGLRFLTIDMEAVDREIFDGDGPAYKLMSAMCSVEREEGWDGHKGAPRVLLAALLRLAELSGSTARITTRQRSED